MLDTTLLHRLGFSLLEKTSAHELYINSRKNLVLKIKPYYKIPTLTYAMITRDEFNVYNGIIDEELISLITKLN